MVHYFQGILIGKRNNIKKWPIGIFYKYVESGGKKKKKNSGNRLCD